MIFLLLFVPLLILHAAAVTLIWGWFLVPLFHFPPIGMAAAIGISCLVDLFMYKTPATDPDTTAMAIGGLLAPLILLAVAFVAKQFL